MIDLICIYLYLCLYTSLNNNQSGPNWILRKLMGIKYEYIEKEIITVTETSAFHSISDSTH